MARTCAGAATCGRPRHGHRAGAAAFLPAHPAGVARGRARAPPAAGCTTAVSIAGAAHAHRGEAQVAFTIQPDGSVRNARLLSSTPPGMFEASALAVAQRWRFEATGRAHDSSRTVHFRLPPEAARDG
ncbi:MAG: TonB family protein [Pseudoxanthomonas sp.]|nr:MAG: TonB family protein [Pseudoxanthomonas sp.]